MFMLLGTLGAMVNGLSMPAFNVLFGKVIDTLNGSKSSFADNIDQLCISIVVIGVINLFTGFLQVFCTLTLYLQI